MEPTYRSDDPRLEACALHEFSDAELREKLEYEKKRPQPNKARILAVEREMTRREASPQVHGDGQASAPPEPPQEPPQEPEADPDSAPWDLVERVAKAERERDKLQSALGDMQLDLHQARREKKEAERKRREAERQAEESLRKGGTEPGAQEPEPEPEPEPAQYEPFPVGALPGPVRAYVRASTRALGEEVPPAMVAVPTLSALSGAIGDAARLELKRSWTEPATLWTVLVAPSGSTKSPAFNHAIRPVNRRETAARDEHEKALADWNAQEDPDERDKPTRKRFRTGDATPEAVVKILEKNPRGVLLARDELGAWIGSFDRYVNGAADLQFWVEVWQGFQASRDRAGEGNTTVDSPAVPVTGTIQPGTLKEKLDEIHFDTGFAARLILCEPPTRPKRWTEADVTAEVREQYERHLTALYGTPRGTTVSLSPEAKRLWIEYYNGANAEMETRPDGPAKSVAAKGITHTARLALILHLGRRASGEADTNEVDAGSMEAALQLGQWLTEETLRVYRMHSLGGRAKPPIRRFLERLPERFETSDAKEIAESNDIPERTCEKWLRDLTDSSDLEKIKRGLYRKP
jgi:hypothetical protein